MSSESPLPRLTLHRATDEVPTRPEDALCRPAGNEVTICPACGAELHLWANYHRCRNCGYKESCCF